MKKRILKNIDWGIFICAIILCGIGTIALFSATHDSGYESLQKQLIWFVICIPIVFIIIFIDYELIAKFAPICYRNMHNFANSSFIYKANKWSKQLVRPKSIYSATSRICKDICYIATCNFNM